MSKGYAVWVLIAFLILSCKQDKQGAPQPPEEKAEQAGFYVGTRFYQWTDQDRTDPQYGGPRAIDVQIWYPASDTTERAPYLPDFADVRDRLEWVGRDIVIAARAMSASYLDAPPVPGTSAFPVLMFSPGLGEHRAFSTMYAEYFARKGYVVIGVNHLYESAWVRQDQGIVMLNHAFHDSLKALQIPEQITAEGYRIAKGRRTIVLAQDLGFCLDQCANVSDRDFEGRLDLANVGVWGHSIGGAAAIDLARIDRRVCAVINFDGTPSGLALTRGMDQPFMFIEDITDLSQKGYEIQNERRNIFCSYVKAEAYRVMIGGAHHNSFSDFEVRAASGERNRKKAQAIINIALSYMEQFFNKYVRNEVVAIAPWESDSLRVLVIP